MLSLLTLLLAPSPALLPPQPPAIIRVDDRDDDDDRGRGHRKPWKQRNREERDHDEDEWRQWARHHHDEDEQGEDGNWDFDHPRHEHRCPPWMDPWWGARQGPRYVAVAPDDPSRCYVYIDGSWILRRVRDVGFQADISDVVRLPSAPPPVPLPHIGLNLHVVLFN